MARAAIGQSLSGWRPTSWLILACGQYKPSKSVVIMIRKTMAFFSIKPSIFTRWQFLALCVMVGHARVWVHYPPAMFTLKRRSSYLTHFFKFVARLRCSWLLSQISELKPATHLPLDSLTFMSCWCCSSYWKFFNVPSSCKCIVNIPRAGTHKQWNAWWSRNV